MPIISGYDITYQMHSVTHAGIYAHDTPQAMNANTLFWDLGYRGPERLLRPVDKIHFHANVQIRTTPTAKGKIEIGFIQNVVSFDSVVHYGEEGKITFSRYFPDFPVKDGGGTPWYREEEADLFETEQLSHPKNVSFSITTSDQPKFGFPTEVRKKAAARASVAEKFKTWLAVRIDGEALYFLHVFTWRFDAKWYSEGNPNPLSYGITVKSERPLLSPYAQPAVIILEGRPGELVGKDEGPSLNPGAAISLQLVFAAWRSNRRTKSR